jgi:hypothetical protein
MTTTNCTAQAQEILCEILTLVLDTSAELDLENPSFDQVHSKAAKINEFSIKLLKSLL